MNNKLLVIRGEGEREVDKVKWVKYVIVFDQSTVLSVS